MPTHQTAAEGNRHRLAAAIELIESCQEMGERLDPETAMAVLVQSELELAREAERTSRSLPPGVKLPPATLEDIRDLHALIAAARILWDVAACIQLRTNPGRRLRLVLKARDLVFQEIVQPILLSMPPGERTPALEQATSWQYTLWGPDHIRMMNDVLDRAISGKPPTKQVKEAAQYLKLRFIPTPDLDRMRQSSSE